MKHHMKTSYTLLLLTYSFIFFCAEIKLQAQEIIQSGNNVLFECYPALRNHISYISLGTLPTPIKKLETLSQELGISLYIKQDSMSGKQCADGTRYFGGNKVRKLEFLLADACAQGAQSVLTFGCVGSNHVVATACYSRLLGLQPIAILKHQPNSLIVQRNLLLMNYYGTHLNLFSHGEFHLFVSECLEHINNAGNFPYIIPTGGSVPLGIIGFVNAVFELKQQINDGIIPQPDYIYVAAGSLGTTVGLMLGIKATGLKTRLIPVSIQPINVSSVKKTILSLFHETNTILSNADSSFPSLNITEDEITIVENFSGNEYGLCTQETQNAIKLLFEHERIKLDSTYTGKTFAALVHDSTLHNQNNKIILFWNTFCDDSYDDILGFDEYKKLPDVFHTYFETNVQELDY